MKTSEYSLLVVTMWFSTCIVPMQYYSGIIGFRLEKAGGDETGFCSDLWACAFAGAVITVPLSASYIANKVGLGLAHGVANTHCLLNDPFCHKNH